MAREDREQTAPPEPPRADPFWALFDSLPLGAVLFERSGDRFVAFNDAACSQLGYSREAFARLKVGDIDLMRSGMTIAAERATLHPGMAPRRFVTRQRAADGRIRHVDVTLQCIELAGRIYGYAVWSDLTDREQAIASLKAREVELARVQRIGRVGGFEIDLRTGFANQRSPEYLRLHGLGENAVNEPHEAWVNRLHPEDRERIDRFFRETVASDARDYEAEYRTLAPDGQVRWISAVAEIERDADGRPLRMIGAHIDITALRQAESTLARYTRRLEQVDRRKNAFLAMLGHELRNPLAPILTLVERLQSEAASLPPDVARAHDVIRRQALHLRVLVDDLLDLARITTGRIKLDNAPVDVAAAIAAAIEQTIGLVRQRGHRLTCIGPGGAPVADFGSDGASGAACWVVGDSARLTQVVANLVGNAAKYTEPGGHVTVSLDRATGARGAGEVVVVVEDDGIGIPAEALPEVFDLFGGVDDRRAFDGAGHAARGIQDRPGFAHGLGIGLTLVKRLVEMHRGHVTATSAGPGLGSRFEVRLPAIAAPAATAAPAAIAAPAATVDTADEPGAAAGTAAGRANREAAPIAPRRILIVDDNRDAAEAMAELLGIHGHVVATHGDGNGALAAALAFTPDVILLDLGLPDRDGFQVADALRGQPSLRDVLLVAVTGYGLDEDRRRTAAHGFDHHLVKPVDFGALARLLGGGEPAPDRS